MILSKSRPPPVVFLGPSAPPDDVLSEIPNAVILPPIARGDLYRMRILKHSIFIIVDGTFQNRTALSPREVVDVLKDGAAVFGLSSIGALRAADCAPAGAIGMGQIYRMYRRRAISSEDEVAVVYNPERPFPSLSTPLVNMRLTMRRARRFSLIDAPECERIINAASQTHYAERTWPRSFKIAGVNPSPALSEFVHRSDPKREDVQRGMAAIAKMQRKNEIGERARCSYNTFGLTEDDRERPPDVFDGATKAEIAAPYVEWLMLSGKFRETLQDSRSLLEWFPDAASLQSPDLTERVWENSKKSPSFDKTMIAYHAFRRALSEVKRLGISTAPMDLRIAEIEVSETHGFNDWLEMHGEFQANPTLARRFSQYLVEVSSVKSLKRYLFKSRKSKTRTRGRPKWRR